MTSPRIVYQVAMSLDGYIAGPKGEFDWIVPDPDIDFAALFARFDTFLMGRRTFALTQQPGAPPPQPGTRTFVFSRTLADAGPGVTICREITPAAIAEIRKQAKKDIWLFGGGELFRNLLDAGFVDSVEVAVVPVLLGGGIPLLPAPARQAQLKLTHHRLYQKSGIVLLEYAVRPPTPRGARKAGKRSEPDRGER